MDVKTTLIAGAALATGLAIGTSGQPDIPQDRSAEQQQSVGDFPDLVAGLKATPGCIEVRNAVLPGGMFTIFAWFENKAAVNAWYTSPMHQGAMKQFFPGMRTQSEALPAFKDEDSPLLVVATVTPSEKPTIEGSNLAVSQIAIEIYTPVPGGITFGGGFGPEALKVPGLRRIDIGGE